MAKKQGNRLTDPMAIVVGTVAAVAVVTVAVATAEVVVVVVVGH